MKQADPGINPTSKRTKKGYFLAQMERVVPWADLVDLIAPYYPEGKNSRPPFALETMLPVRFMQQCLSVTWHIAMKPGQRKMLRKDNACDVLVNALEKLKTGIWAKVEHPFRVVKRQFGCTLVRYRALKKNTVQYVTLFALSNLWMVRSKLMGMQACVRLQTGKRPGRR